MLGGAAGLSVPFPTWKKRRLVHAKRIRATGMSTAASTEEMGFAGAEASNIEVGRPRPMCSGIMKEPIESGTAGSIDNNNVDNVRKAGQVTARLEIGVEE